MLTSTNFKLHTMSKNITIAQAKKYIVSKYGQSKHNVKVLVLACRKLAKETNHSSRDLFHLMIENKDFGCNTHSYGFNTAYGRELRDTLHSYYYQIDRGLNEDQVLILN